MAFQPASTGGGRWLRLASHPLALVFIVFVDLFLHLTRSGARSDFVVFLVPGQRPSRSDHCMGGSGCFLLGTRGTTNIDFVFKLFVWTAWLIVLQTAVLNFDGHRQEDNGTCCAPAGSESPNAFSHCATQFCDRHCWRFSCSQAGYWGFAGASLQVNTSGASISPSRHCHHGKQECILAMPALWAMGQGGSHLLPELRGEVGFRPACHALARAAALACRPWLVAGAARNMEHAALASTADSTPFVSWASSSLPERRQRQRQRFWQGQRQRQGQGYGGRWQAAPPQRSPSSCYSRTSRRPCAFCHCSSQSLASSSGCSCHGRAEIAAGVGAPFGPIGGPSQSLAGPAHKSRRLGSQAGVQTAPQPCAKEGQSKSRTCQACTGTSSVRRSLLGHVCAAAPGFASKAVCSAYHSIGGVCQGGGFLAGYVARVRRSLVEGCRRARWYGGGCRFGHGDGIGAT